MSASLCMWLCLWGYGGYAYGPMPIAIPMAVAMPMPIVYGVCVDKNIVYKDGA